MADDVLTELELRPPARLRTVLAWSALVGVGGGLLGFTYLGTLHLFEHVLGPGARDPWLHLLVMAGVGAVVGLFLRLLGSPGDIELLVDNVHVLEGPRAEVRHLRSLLPVSLLCIASGGGMGPEAPLVQTTGTAAQWIGERLRLSGIDRRMLTIAGMASAFTVLFGAPIGAALFALEILHRRGMQYHEALLPAVVASLIGYGVYVAASGLGLTPVWNFTMESELAPVDLVWAIGAGLVGGAVALGFTHAVELARRAIDPVPELWRPLLGGVLLGSLALLSPYALTYGKYQINPLLSTVAAPASFFALAALAKFVGTTVTVVCGWRGGFIIPLFFIGAALGHAFHALVPSANEAVVACALMAAASTGVTKTPLGSTLVVSKMVGLALVPSTAVAAVIALLLTHRSGLLASQRERIELE
ncbi:MAG: chloride channel protein [Planctomycetota bacterium]|nr:chloride channel protein [Planctomycetota bacterium]